MSPGLFFPVSPAKRSIIRYAEDLGGAESCLSESNDYAQPSAVFGVLWIRGLAKLNSLDKVAVEVGIEIMWIWPRLSPNASDEAKLFLFNQQDRSTSFSACVTFHSLP